MHSNGKKQLSLDDEQTKPKSAMEYAKIAIKNTRNALRLGSSNISKFFYDLRIDKHVLIPGLFSSSTSSKFEALSVLKPEEKVEDLSNRRVVQIKYAPNPYHQDDPNKSQKQNILDSALTLQVGNCGELSLCAVAMLRKAGYTGRVELVKFEFIDHTFLIINRPHGTFLDDWKSWGNETVIVDPWLNESFRGDKFEKFWKEKIRKFSLNQHLTAELGIGKRELSGKEVSGKIEDEMQFIRMINSSLLKVELIEENPKLEIDPKIKPQFQTVELKNTKK